jgi:Endosomal/lysosomal potassium channel TMEM175
VMNTPAGRCRTPAGAGRVAKPGEVWVRAQDDKARFSNLWPLWPTAINYAVSYLFLAIIWTNHHYLMQFAGPPQRRD